MKRLRGARPARRAAVHTTMFHAALGLWCIAPAVASALTCVETGERHAVPFSGEIAGRHSFSRSVGDGWTFRLEPQPYGWSIRLRARDGIDLSQITPPFRGPNPRELSGWHFRNLDNSGANDGSVNAPQTQRLFQFSPALEGTGGYRPPSPDATPAGAAGRGWFELLDYGFADLAAGQKARLVYMKFSGCLTWPTTEDERRDAADRKRRDFTSAEIERFASCGLPRAYRLEAYIRPRLLEGHLDDDDALDVAAPAVRPDGKRGLAVCRSGTSLDLIGFGRRLGQIDPGYYDQVETWSIRAVAALADYGGAAPLPSLDHDVLVLERVEKSSYTIFWFEGKFGARRDYWYVEP